MRIALNSTLLTAVALSTAAAASPQIADVRELLREAGKLIPQIEKGQQSSAASNISGAQVRAGDLAGALETVRSVLIPENTDRPRPNLMDYYGISWNLAKQGISEFKPEQSVWPLWNVTEQLVAAGRTSDAIALAHAQEFPRARAYALLGTATSLMSQIEAANRKR
jgi:hypothetical protein